MSEQRQGISPERLEEARKLEAALQKAFREEILGHARAGFSVPTSRDGKVVWLTPDEVFKMFNAPRLAKPDDNSGAA